MSDLIRREDVIKLVNQFVFGLCKAQNDEVIKIFNKHIEKIPTAYNVDEVVEELEERTDFLKDCTKYGNKNAKQQAESYSTTMMYEVADLVDDLIEIVKHGDVSDDVCEWEYVDAYSYYKVGCKENIVPIQYGDYCPYCGKKIKIVGD